MLLPLALLALVAPVLRPAGEAECATAARAATALVVRTVVAASDSTMRVALCMEVPAGRRVGSYHGELTFAATDARVLRVEKPADGMRIENTRVPGKVAFAAAAPNGLGSGTLLVVVLRPSRAGAPVLRLRMLELNDVSGASLLGITRADSVTVPPTVR